MAGNGSNSAVSAIYGLMSGVSAAYDAKYLTVGAIDAPITSGGKKRSVSYFQVAGISPTTGTTAVSGNYPTGLS